MTPEGFVLRAVLDLLAAKRILAFRNNVGVMRGSHKGKSWFVKFGSVGMADIVCYPRTLTNLIVATSPKIEMCEPVRIASVLWIECKAVGKKQMPEQESFQKIVEDNGHSYLVVDDIDVLISWLKERGL